MLSEITPIVTKHLQFRYKKGAIFLKDINLRVSKGSIYGFLGPNGAGKTTTMRLLLGLLKSNAGSVELFGKSLSGKPSAIFANIGALVEQPSLYEHLTGYDNLDITRSLKGLDRKSIDRVLETVNLTAVAQKKVKAYSLGMKQRLGIALALLGEPELLILDEPVNGLDPAGMVEIRNLILKLNQERAMTIFISSHLLSEIQRVATEISILNMGRVIFQGTIADLESIQQSQFHFSINTEDNARSFELLKTHYQVTLTDKHLSAFVTSKSDIGHIISTLVHNDISVYEAFSTENFETLFLNLTQDHFLQ